MSTWGPGVFSNDLAADVREEYRSLLEDKVADEEATRRVLDAFGDVDEEEQPDLWLGLAAAQHEVGRLDEQVKTRALTVIDSGQGQDAWADASPKGAARRKAILEKLRAQLTGPQPTPKRIRRPRQEVTDLAAGDVLAYTSSTGEMALLRVLRISRSRQGDVPVLGWLDWRGRTVPDVEHLQRLPVRVQDDFDLAQYGDDVPPVPRPVIELVHQATPKGPDWRAVGFVLAGRTTPSADDEAAEEWGGTDWENLAHSVAHRLTRS